MRHAMMLNGIEIETNTWRKPAIAVAASLAVNAAVVLTFSFSPPRVHSDADAPVLVEVTLTDSMQAPCKNVEAPLNEPEPFAGAFTVQNNLPTENFAAIQPDATKLNGLLDTEEGGTELRPEGKRSGGGGGDGAESVQMGHVATDDRVWARMKWKPDPTAKEVAAGDANGRGTTVPGVLKNPGAGAGLGNGKGSGALGSQGSGTGSGAGINGSNIGNGLGTAPPLPVSRKPSVVSMNRGLYPASARVARHEGTVVLNVEVLPTGSVGQVRVKSSSGYDELDDAATSAAKEWQFTGALRDGIPVSFWYAIPYRFVLTEQ